MASRNRHQSTARSTPHRPSAAAAAAPAPPADAPPLPPYKRPTRPLTTAAQDQLRALNGYEITKYEEQCAHAGDKLAEAAALIFDKLRERRHDVDGRQRALWAKGMYVHEREAVEARLDEVQRRVEEMAGRLEEGVRAVVDAGVAAGRVREVLGEVGARQQQEEQMQRMQRMQMQTQTQTQTQTQEEEGMDDPTPGPTLPGMGGEGEDSARVTPASEMFAERMARKKDVYTAISLAGRYGENAAYVNFKRMAHDAKYGDEAPPLPEPERWFTQRGSPAPGMTGHGVDHGDDNDDDIVMDRATVSMRCPLTFQRFKEPFTSTKCPHTFEKNAILEMIRRSTMRVGGGARGGDRAVECPVTGCAQVRMRNYRSRRDVLFPLAVPFFSFKLTAW